MGLRFDAPLDWLWRGNYLYVILIPSAGCSSWESGRVGWVLGSGSSGRDDGRQLYPFVPQLQVLFYYLDAGKSGQLSGEFNGLNHSYNVV